MAIDPETGYAVGQLEVFVVGSLTNQSLVDVLFVTDDGWLRHSTSEEFRARQRIGERNRQGVEEVEKQSRKAAQTATRDGL